MNAKEFINKSLPILRLDDTGNQALELMDQFKVAHLPLVDGSNYLCLVKEDDIYDYNIEDKQLRLLSNVYFRPYLLENYSLLDILSYMSDLKVSVIPVLSRKQQFLGSILIYDMFYKAIEMLGFSAQGAVLTLRIKKQDLSLAYLSQLVEANNIRILSYFVINEQGDYVRVVLKLNTQEILSLVQSLESYDYEIESVLFDDEQYTKLYKERLDALLSYLSI